MTAGAKVSHVASPRECDTRQRAYANATSDATGVATTMRQPASLRDLARDILMRQGRDKAVARVATELRDSINRCCDVRGDDDINRAALIFECSRLNPIEQLDMLDHFRDEAERWGASLIKQGESR